MKRVLAALLALGLVAPLAWRWLLAGWVAGRPGEAVGGALGTDAVLWGLTARDLAVGAPPLVPPAYPALLGLVDSVTSVGLPTAGTTISLVAAGLLPASVGWLAGRSGARPGWCLAVGLTVLLCPDLGIWAQQLQPEALTAAWGVLLAGALRAACDDEPSPTWGLVLLAGLAPLLREHGLLLALVASAILLILRTSAWRAVAAIASLIWLLPLLVPGSSLWPPGHGSWTTRAGGALAALMSDDPAALGFLTELRRPEREAYLALVEEGGVLGRVRWHAARSLTLAVDAWGWIAAAGVAALASRRRQLMAPAALLLVAVPALLIWSQRRHVTVLLPIAWLVLALALSAWSRRRLAVAVGLGLLAALSWTWPARWLSLADAQLDESRHEAHLSTLGQWICDHAEPEALLGGRHQDVGLSCPLPRHDPDGSLADWRTWTVDERSPGQGWKSVHGEPEGLRVWRLDPDRSPRPCAGVENPRPSPHLVVGPAQVELACEEPDPRDGAG